MTFSAVTSTTAVESASTKSASVEASTESATMKSASTHSARAAPETSNGVVMESVSKGYRPRSIKVVIPPESAVVRSAPNHQR